MASRGVAWRGVRACVCACLHECVCAHNVAHAVNLIVLSVNLNSASPVVNLIVLSVAKAILGLVSRVPTISLSCGPSPIVQGNFAQFVFCSCCSYSGCVPHPASQIMSCAQIY